MRRRRHWQRDPFLCCALSYAALFAERHAVAYVEFEHMSRACRRGVIGMLSMVAIREALIGTHDVTRLASERILAVSCKGGVKLGDGFLDNDDGRLVTVLWHRLVLHSDDVA